MERKLYRVLNEKESSNFHYTSHISQSHWEGIAIKFREQIEKVCGLS